MFIKLQKLTKIGKCRQLPTLANLLTAKHGSMFIQLKVGFANFCYNWQISSKPKLPKFESKHT